mgnify:CR=1 FL=1
MPFHVVNGLKYYSFASFDEVGVLNAIFTRHGGVSKKPWKSLNTGGTVGDEYEDVRENLKRMFQVAGREFSSRYDGWQVHGDIVLRVEEPRPETANHVKLDGLITDQKDVSLLMRFADCVPVMLVDPIKHVVGLVHAGWKGTVLQIARKAVLRMKEEYGTKPEDVLAGIGPSIGPDDYEVGFEVIQAARESFGQAAEACIVQNRNSYHFDLWKANETALRNVGVRNIECAGISTYSHVEDWFSHRRENGKTGRFGAIIALRENGS